MSTKDFQKLSLQPDALDQFKQIIPPTKDFHKFSLQADAFQSQTAEKKSEFMFGNNQKQPTTQAQEQKQPATNLQSGYVVTNPDLHKFPSKHFEQTINNV
jgi:hypothetical protein